jgi:hypothetical protein
VPCSSQVTAAHHPETLAKPVLDGAFAIRDIYLRLLGPMKELQELESLSSAGIMGVGWATAAASPPPGGGELPGRGRHRQLHPHAGGDRGRPASRGRLHRAVRLRPGVRGGLPDGGESLRRPDAHQKSDEGPAGLPQPLQSEGEDRAWSASTRSFSMSPPSCWTRTGALPWKS